MSRYGTTVNVLLPTPVNVQIQLQMFLTDLQNVEVCSVVQKCLHAFVQPQHWIIRVGSFLPGRFNAYGRDLEGSRRDGEFLK